jgi:hypothetical protein
MKQIKLHDGDELTAHIVQLSEHRRRLRPAPRPSTAQPEHYFCLRCDADQFRLFPGGTVNCARCGALMYNLAVAEKQGPGTG